MQLFSIESFTRLYFPAKPVLAISMAPYLYNLLFERPRVWSWSLFLMMSAMNGAPDWSILLAKRYKSLNCEWFSMAFLSASRSSPLRLQLLRAKDLSYDLLLKDWMNCMAPGPLCSYKLLWVKNKSVSVLFDWRPTANIWRALSLIWLWLMYICWIFLFACKVWEIGLTWASVRLFLRRLRFLSGSKLNRLVKVSPLMWLLSMSILLNCFLFFSVAISAWAPSLSISLFESWSSSRQAHLLMNSQIDLHPFEVILLSDMLRTWRLCFFLFERALITMDTPSSPMLFPLRLSSLMVFERAKQSSRLFIP